MFWQILMFGIHNIVLVVREYRMDALFNLILRKFTERVLPPQAVGKCNPN